MSNFRVLYDNAADRATLSVANTAAGLGAANLLTDLKGEVCRVLSGTAQIVMTWGQLETVGVVVFPTSNLSAESTIRVRAYLDSVGTTLLSDTGVVFAAPANNVDMWDWTGTLNVNAFSDGMSNTTQCYLPSQVAARRVVIDIVDPLNTFIDLPRLVVGGYLQTQYGASYGATVGTTDLTKNSRAASGDLRSDWGPRSNNLTVDLDLVTEQDRARIRQILARGIGKFLFVSAAAGCEDPVKERDFSIYGKQAQTAAMAYKQYSLHNTQIQLEGF